MTFFLIMLIVLMGGTVYFLMGIYYCRIIVRRSDYKDGSLLLLMRIQNTTFSGRPVPVRLNSPELLAIYGKVEALVKIHSVFVLLCIITVLLESRL